GIAGWAEPRIAAVNELSQHLARLRWAQQQWTTPRWCSRPSAEACGGRVGIVTRVEGCYGNETVHSFPLFRKECPKRRRNALPGAGFMLEKCLIFPGDASSAPVSHAVAAEMTAIPFFRGRLSQGAKWRMLVERPATTAPIDQGSERRVRPQ